MTNPLIRPFIKFGLDKYKTRKITPSVRAVFLGDGVSTSIILYGIYERYELDVLKRYVFPNLPQNSNCLDIGANIGNHTNTFSPYFKKIYAFEPNPVVQLLLRANTMGKNVDVIECGLSNQKCMLPFTQNFSNLGASRISDRKTEGGQSIQVERLDNVVADRGIKDVSFIKIDVEGHEKQVLEGGLEFLKREQPIIAMESLFGNDTTTGKQITQLLANIGYSHFYQPIPKSALIRLLAPIPSKLKRFFLWPFPAHWRKALILRKIETLEGIDADLALASCHELPI